MRSESSASLWALELRLAFTKHTGRRRLSLSLYFRLPTYRSVSQWDSARNNSPAGRFCQKHQLSRCRNICRVHFDEPCLGRHRCAHGQRHPTGSRDRHTSVLCHSRCWLVLLGEELFWRPATVGVDCLLHGWQFINLKRRQPNAGLHSMVDSTN